MSTPSPLARSLAQAVLHAGLVEEVVYLLTGTKAGQGVDTWHARGAEQECSDHTESSGEEPSDIDMSLLLKRDLERITLRERKHLQKQRSKDTA